MAEGTFIKLIQNGKKPVMSTVIIQTEMLRRVCADGTENNINANASIGSGYVLVGRKHNDDDHGPTTIYEAKLEIIDQATGKKINGLKSVHQLYSVNQVMENVVTGEKLNSMEVVLIE